MTSWSLRQDWLDDFDPPTRGDGLIAAQNRSSASIRRAVMCARPRGRACVPAAVGQLQSGGCGQTHFPPAGRCGQS